MKGQLELAAAPDRACRGIVQLATVLGVVRLIRIVGQRPEWRKAGLELMARDDERRLYKAAVLATVWGEEALAPRALVETDGEWFEEFSMVLGLLAWLAWDLGIDAVEAAIRDGQQRVQDESWYGMQLFGVLDRWIRGDANALEILSDGVFRTPRFGVDSEKWTRWHSALLQAYAKANAEPDGFGQSGRHPRPGNLAVLKKGESPRVRVVVEIRAMSIDVRIVIVDPQAADGKRTFVGSRVATLEWVPLASREAASA